MYARSVQCESQRKMQQMGVWWNGKDNSERCESEVFYYIFFFIGTYNLLAVHLLTVTVILYIHIVWYYVRGKQMETQHGGNRQ